MTNKKRSLGKGLNELLSASLTLGSSPFGGEQSDNSITIESQGSAGERGEPFAQLSVDSLLPGRFQPRSHIRHEGLEQLAESIRAQGILQPIIVRVKEDAYEIVAGERRWRAAKLAGLATVPVVIRHVPDDAAMAIALIENIQRENLNAMEEAVALKRLADELQLTHLQVAEAVGKSRASVTNILRLLNLNADVQQLLEQDQIEMGHARALLGLKGDRQSDLAQKVVQKGLSVRETERLVNKLQEEALGSPVTIVVVRDPNIRHLEEDLAEKLGAKVAIRHGQRGKGMLVIRYNDLDELDGILAHIK